MAKSKVQKFFYVVFILIFFLGFLVRIWDLDKNPAGFFADEASVGYNAYSILKRGRDEWGEKMPLFFKAFGEYKNPLDIYLTTIPIFIFGLNEFSVRLISVIFSMLTGLMFFFIGKELKSKYFGLLLSAIFFITPWSIHLGRINFEGFDILLFLYLLASHFLILFIKMKKRHFLYLFSLSLGLANYSYFPARIITPILFFTIILFLLIKKIKISKIFLSLIVYLIVSLPLFFHIFYGGGLSRWEQVSLLKQKDINPVKKIAKSYLLHFSPDFLFIKGDIDMKGQFITRHSVRGIGEFYPWQMVFIIIGLLTIMKKLFDLDNLYFFLLLVLFPIPSSLTTDLTPQATRSLTGILPVVFLTGLGLWQVHEFIKKRSKRGLSVFVFLMTIVIVYFFVGYLKLYQKYPLYSSDYWGWQYGPREIITYFKSVSKDYDEL